MAALKLPQELDAAPAAALEVVREPEGSKRRGGLTLAN
jgi:hypothetical protein